MSDTILAELGPLAPLAGTWYGERGVDVAPSVPGEAAVETRFRERLVFEPIGPVRNGSQILHGLRYSTTAWPLGESEPFHEENGYWLWCAAGRLVQRCFVVPRVVTVQAGGTVEQDARHFTLRARAGSEVFGILNSPHLALHARSVSYTLNVTVHGDGAFSYDEDTQLVIPGLDAPFHHTDRNSLRRV